MNDRTEYAPFREGSFVRGYEVLQQIGEGGFSHVYIVRDRSDREFALKSAHSPQVAKFLEKNIGLSLLHEAKIMRRYGTHEGLPRLYDAWEDNRRAHVLMECVPGISLAELSACWAYPLSKLHICCMLVKMLDPLHHLHTLPDPVYHMDVKPNNFLTNGRRFTLIDFGLSQCEAVGLWKFKSERLVVGTPSFFPPEQLKDEGDIFGPERDLYAVGLIGYVMVSGKKLRRKFPDNWQDVYPPLIPEEGPLATLAAIINRALALNPDDRYPSAKAFMDALLNVL